MYLQENYAIHGIAIHEKVYNSSKSLECKNIWVKYCDVAFIIIFGELWNSFVRVCLFLYEGYKWVLSSRSTLCAISELDNNNDISNNTLQRAWAQNESLRKSTFYDVHTVGAFNAFAQKTKSQGLIKTCIICPKSYPILSEVSYQDMFMPKK